MNQEIKLFDKYNDYENEGNTQNKEMSCEAGEVGATRDPESFGSDLSMVGEPSPDNREAALRWSDYGLVVIPTEPGSTKPTVDVKRWPADCNRNIVDAHWWKHPGHDVGFVVGSNLVVVGADSLEAQAALHQVEKALGIRPNMTVNTPMGVEHCFWLKKGTRVSPDLESRQRHVGHIDLKTGSAIVLLPPHTGKVLALDEASSTSDFTAVGQAFIDAVQKHNSEPHQIVPEVDLAVAVSNVEPMVAAVTPITAPTVPAAGQVEGGEAGEGGGRSVAAATPAASQTVSPDVALEAGKGGEGGVLPVANQKIDTSAFMALQVTALVGVSSKIGGESTIRHTRDDADDVLTPKAVENPVVVALKARAFYKTPLGSGSHEITCPWAHEHTDGLETSATYFEPDDLKSTGGFCCQYPHPKRHTTNDMLALLGVQKTDARHKPVIRVVDGEMHRVLDAAEMVLETCGNHYQSGGMIVSVATDPNTGDPSIVPTNVQALTRALSVAATFERHIGHSDTWVPCDPPMRHVGLLYNAQTYGYLSPLAGVARQPYFREADGELVTQPGYDKGSKRFGVFEPRQFVIPEPTIEAARAALTLLEDLLSEFRFAENCDKATALSAMLTAVVRSSLKHAPAFHVKAAIYGSGKSYMCEIFSAFAGPAPSAKVSYPATSEEATKSMLSLLVKNPAVIEFDDMASDWIPHGAINRMLTSEHITDRILGVSKTATVSTSTLFLGSGNNVGPVRDLLRRVATINLDPRCATPATITYNCTPVETIRKHRGAYVAAALTIILAWRKAGSPRGDVSSIATYGGSWADHCRHPLIWLGQPDPATSLLEQVKHDPDSDALGGLMTEWYRVFGSSPTTVRKVIATAKYGNDDLNDAICEFPVVERGEFNASKLGWLLKRNVNRIVEGLEFKEAMADGRKAWRVIPANPPASPPSIPTAAKTVALQPVAKPGIPEIDLDLY